MKYFKFHWLDKTTNIGWGIDAADALTRLGYGAGALRALDYWECIGDKASD